MFSSVVQLLVFTDFMNNAYSTATSKEIMFSAQHMVFSVLPGVRVTIAPVYAGLQVGCNLRFGDIQRIDFGVPHLPRH